MRGTFLGTALAAGLLLAGCVAGTGDYSEFAVKKGEAAPAAASAQGVRLAGGVYEGGLRNGVPEGKGVFRYDDGRRYDGGFAGGRFDGEGRMQYPDGRRVEGRFAGDVEDKVTLTYPDGRVFDGAVRKGVPQGAGTMSLPNGGSITGRFQDGRAEGRALQRKPDGSMFFGPFVRNEPQGSGVCSGAGGASACTRDGNLDTTASTLEKLAQQRALEAQERGRKEALAALERESAPRREAAEKERNALRAERDSSGGPTRDGDFNCWCAIASLCLSVVDSNDRTPADVRRMQQERRVLECRKKYAAWLGIKEDPNYAKKMADLNKALQGAQQRMDEEAAERRRKQKEIEAEWARRKADAKEQERLRNIELAKEQAERAKRLEASRQECRRPEFRRINPCHCEAVLGEKRKPVKGAACEA